jgi:hypothetical protein
VHGRQDVSAVYGSIFLAVAITLSFPVHIKITFLAAKLERPIVSTTGAESLLLTPLSISAL